MLSWEYSDEEDDDDDDAVGGRRRIGGKAAVPPQLGVTPSSNQDPQEWYVF